MSYAPAELEHVVDVIRGITFPTSAKGTRPAPGLIPCLRTTNVQEQITWDDLLYVPKEYVRNDMQRLRAGDILVSMSNSRDLVGKCAIATTVPKEATFGAFIAVVRAKDGIDPRYIFHAMRSPSFRAHVRNIASTTTNISNINSSKLLAATIPVFGTKTRERIVSRVEELFSRIGEGERAVDAVRNLVRGYRHSVLKAAVTGELTREWREKHNDKLEPGHALLQRILKARRDAWEEAELDRMNVKGKKPVSETWKERYQEPSPLDPTDLPRLPEGWVWAAFGQLIWSSQNGLSKRSGVGGRPVKVLRLADISDGAIDGREPRSIALTEDEVDRYCLEEGDLLCVRVNGSRNLTGRLVPVETREEWAYCDHFIRFQPVPQLVAYRLLDLCFDAGITRRRVEAAMVTTAGQNTVSQGSLLQVPVPLPPLDEQAAIISEVSKRLSQASRQLSDIVGVQLQSTGLRQSVLRSAFAGNLVPEHPSDEPASALLERIAVKPKVTDGLASNKGRRQGRGT